MARNFNGTSDHIIITDDDALTLPDSDWSLGGWIRLTDNIGSLYQYLFSWNWNTTPNVIAYITEASLPVDPDRLSIKFIDNDGTILNVTAGGISIGQSTSWQHILWVRSGNTLSQYINGVFDTSETSVNFDGVNPAANFYLGSRNDLDADRFFKGDLAEWAKWDRALSESDIQSLATGYSPLFLQRDLKWYLPMDDGLCRETCSGLAVSNYGTTPSDHPRILRSSCSAFTTARRLGPGACRATAALVSLGIAQKGVIHA